MRSFLVFAASLLAILVSAFAGEIVQAKCRCQRVEARATRQQARYDRKCQRRGICAVVPVDQQQPDGTYYNPYGGDQIQPTAGAAATNETEVRWVCNGRQCWPVRVPVTPKPVPDPAFQEVKPVPAKAETPKAETQAPEETVKPEPEASIFPPGVINGT